MGKEKKRIERKYDIGGDYGEGEQSFVVLIGSTGQNQRSCCGLRRKTEAQDCEGMIKAADVEVTLLGRMASA